MQGPKFQKPEHISKIHSIPVTLEKQIYAI